MKVSLRDTAFVVTDVDPPLAQAVLDLGYQREEGEYVRSFRAPASPVARAFANFERNAEEIVLQKAGVRPVPWDQALEAFVSRVVAEPVDWWIAGSTALAVRGVDVAPRDIDLVTDEAGAKRLAEMFGDALVEPLTEVDDWICRWWARSFLGAVVEWVADVKPHVDEPDPADFGPAAARALERLEWRGYEVRVPPLELQLAVTERRGLADRAAAIRRLLR